ncbi:TMEM43 family protein [uncultured Thiodictyon sp.]|uniref:TMEM43 family protein n=1 Tax=uncultured Thiodictyon sp. TaxID=1846217 RepID=UPI0025D2EFFB|nr:TMEM43 family protein [uncultured Thiodictyon sp.]
MSDDSYTEVTSQTWFSRIGGSFKSIVFGLLLFVAAFPLLWWNEGNSVERYNSLKESQGVVVAVAADAVNPANDGRLVHVSGLATTDEILKDEVFGVSAPAIELQRVVTMYQWKESEATETKEQLGGTKTTTKTYSYSKQWSGDPIDSSRFKNPVGHTNPVMPYKSETFQAKDVRLGAFRLNAAQVGRLSGAQALRVRALQMPAPLPGKTPTPMGDGFYLGSYVANPQVGDLQVSFKVINPADVSIVAQQQGNSFSAYHTKAGGDVDLLQMGLLDANAMFAIAQHDNVVMTWIIRVGGFLLMWIGLAMILSPLSALGSVLPFLGNLIAMGTGLLAFLVALLLAMLVIAVAWIFVRPLLAGILIAVAVVALVVMKFMPRHAVAVVDAK